MLVATMCECVNILFVFCNLVTSLLSSTVFVKTLSSIGYLQRGKTSSSLRGLCLSSVAAYVAAYDV